MAMQTDLSTIGLQLYSLRDDLARDVPETLAAVRDMGFTHIEAVGPYGMPPEQFKSALDKAGLHCSGIMLSSDRFADDGAGVTREAKILGAENVGIGWIPHGEYFTAEDAEKVAKDLNAWGESAGRAGLGFFVHIHGYEFQRAGGRTPFDVLAANTDPRHVTFELDVFWAQHGGQDPVELMRQYPDRFNLIHLKDMRAGTPTGVHTGHAPVETSVRIGTGVLDFPAILREARRIGVKYYYIEEEELEARENLPHSLAYLNSLQASLINSPA
jgi:sugar phosphate isomerase/epimerase